MQPLEEVQLDFSKMLKMISYSWEALLSGRNRAIIVGNAQPELMQWAMSETLRAGAQQQVRDDGVAVWPGRCCPPRHPTHFAPLLLNSNGIL